MFWKLLGHGLYGWRKFGAKALVILALVLIVLTSPYWSQVGEASTGKGAVEAEWTPLPLAPTPAARNESVSAVLAVDASAKFADWDCPYKEIFVREGIRVDMPGQLLASVAWFESGYSAAAVSSAGATGIMQIMPGTWDGWSKWPWSDATNAEKSIIVGTDYLTYLRLLFWDDALSEKEIVRRMVTGYCWGPGNVQRKGVQAAPASVRAYAQNILDAAGYK